MRTDVLLGRPVDEEPHVKKFYEQLTGNPYEPVGGSDNHKCGSCQKQVWLDAEQVKFKWKNPQTVIGCVPCFALAAKASGATEDDIMGRVRELGG